MANGIRSLEAFWIGGANQPSHQTGYRGLMGFWMGGVSGGSTTPPIPPTPPTDLIGAGGFVAPRHPNYERLARELAQLRKRQRLQFEDDEIAIILS